MRRFLGLLFAILCLGVPHNIVFAYTTNQPAVTAVGQSNLTGRLYNIDQSHPANGLRAPYGVTTDGTHLIVGDYSNNRVLIWNSIPTSSGDDPDVVIGQTSMTGVTANQGGSADANTLSGPTQVATDGTKLFVTDSTNNRILIFNTIPTTNNASANVVVGQPNMTTVTSGTSQTKMKLPEAVSYDPASGKLIVSDWNNNRVLIYNSVPTSDGATADVVLGQADFNSGTANRGSTTSSGSLSNPYNAHIINEKLFIADPGNNRILIWNTVPTTNGAGANLVIGQTGLTGATANQGGSVAANTLSAVSDVIWDGTGSNLLVSDYSNQRVLVFDGIPTSNNASAVKAIGQPNLTSSSKNQGSDTTTAYAYSLRNAAGGFGLTRNYLIVADTGNNRILIYDNLAPSVSSLSPADNATAVSTSANLVLTFDEVTRVGSGTLSIKKASDNSVVETITLSGALLSGNGSTELTINPSTTLAELTSYYVTWSDHAFKDPTGNFAGPQTSATYWNFTTGDFTAPSLSSVSPSDNSSDVSAISDLVLTFNETVNVGTGSMLLKKSGDGSTGETIAANGSRVSGNGSTTITITPAIRLSYSTPYYVTIDTYAFKDTTGNYYGGISDAQTWNFTTAARSETEERGGSGGGGGGGGRGGSAPGRSGAAPGQSAPPGRFSAPATSPDAGKSSAPMSQGGTPFSSPSVTQKIQERMEKRLSAMPASERSAKIQQRQKQRLMRRSR